MCWDYAWGAASFIILGWHHVCLVVLQRCFKFAISKFRKWDSPSCHTLVVVMTSHSCSPGRLQTLVFFYFSFKDGIWWLDLFDFSSAHRVRWPLGINFPQQLLGEHCSPLERLWPREGQHRWPASPHTVLEQFHGTVVPSFVSQDKSDIFWLILILQEFGDRNCPQEILLWKCSQGFGYFV